MTEQEISSILNNSNSSDWIASENGAYTYRGDVHLRIERGNVSEKFNEPWATKHLDPNAYSVCYTVFYCKSFIQKTILVEVDGFRAILPMPKIGTNIIALKDYNFARIVDNGTLDEYIQHSELIVK